MHTSTNRRVGTFALFALVSLPQLSAQLPDVANVSPSQVAAQHAASVPRSSFGMDHVDGVLRAAGPDYKVDFLRGGFQFTPALGAKVKKNQPLSFELDSISRSDATVCTASGIAVPERNGLRVTYAHPGGVSEHYDVAREGIHQSFVFDEPLPGSGDLVVRGRLSTDLSVRADGPGLRFEYGDLGGVSYGGVTGIDASGNRGAGELRTSNGIIELVLPAAFVDAASYPLVLDPLINSVFAVADSSSQDDADPDIAYGLSTYYLVVWERRFSFTDSDILAQRVLTLGGLQGSMILVATDGNISLNPATAAVYPTGGYFVAWQDSSFLTVPNIRGCSVDALSGARSATVTVSASANAQFNPDVGGERSAADNDALVVWEESGVGIRSRQVQVGVFAGPSPDPIPFGTTRLIDGGTPSATPSNPAISKVAGDAGRFLIAWQMNSNSEFIRARAISRNNALLGDIASVSFFVSGAGDNIEPDVDGDGTDFVVVWSRDEALFSGVYDIYCRSLHFENNALSMGTLRAVEDDDDDDERNAAIAYNGQEYAVAYIDSDTFDNVYIKTIEPGTCYVCQPEEVASAPSSDQRSVAIASQWHGGSSLYARRQMLVWETSAGNGDLDIDGHVYDIEQDLFSNLGGGCGDGGVATASCIHAGNSNFRPRLTGAAPNTPVFLVLALSQVPFSCGGCTFYPDLGSSYVFPDMTNSSGDAETIVPLPDILKGISIPMQWAVLSGTSCAAFGVDMSDAVSMFFP